MPRLPHASRRPLVAVGLIALIALISASAAFALAALRIDGQLRVGGQAKITASGFKRGNYGAYLASPVTVGPQCSGVIALPRGFSGRAVLRGRFPRRLTCYFNGKLVGYKRTRHGGYYVTVCQGGRTGLCAGASIASGLVNLK